MKGFTKIFAFEMKKLFRHRMNLVFLILTAVFAVLINGLNYYVQEVFVPQMQEAAEKMEQQAAENEEESGENGVSAEVTIQAVPETGAPGMSVADEIAAEKAQIKDAENRRAEGSKLYSDADWRNHRNNLAKLEYSVEHGLLAESDPSSPSSGMNLYNKDNAVWQLAAGGGIFHILFAFAATALAVSVAGEYEKGNMKSLVLRPVTRTAIISAKFLSAVIFLFIMQQLFLLMHLLSGFVLFGFGKPGEPMVFCALGKAFSLPSAAGVLFLNMLDFLSALLPLALTLLLAVLLRSAAGTIGLILTITLVLNSLILQLARFVPALRFTPFLHMNLGNYFRQPIMVDHTSIVFSALMAFFYLLAAGAGSVLIFKKRDI